MTTERSKRRCSVNVNFYSEIHFDKFVDSKEIIVPKFILFNIF